MNLGLFVSAISSERAFYTSTRLAYAATDRGHDVFYLDAGSFVYGPGTTLAANVRRAPRVAGRDYDAFVRGVQEAAPEVLRVEDLDAVILRNDPAEDARERPWAVDTGIVFGQAARERGVVVINDPAGLAKAANKAYLQEFPDRVRPRTLIARETDAINSFVEQLGSRVVLKPLLGAKGDKVFFVGGPDDPNLNQVIETIRESGYIVAQEFLDQATEGDVRMFMLDGEPLRHGDAWAAFRRRPAAKELRSNMAAGARAERCDVGPVELGIARAIGPRLRADGMLLVGLDIVGDKLVEVNVQSPGGLGSIERLSGVDFAPIIIAAVERRVAAEEESKGGNMRANEDPVPRPDPAPSPPRPGTPRSRGR